MKISLRYITANVEEVQKNIIHEPLESCRDISQTERYDCPFKRFIVSLESCFPFIFFHNPCQVIYIAEVDLSINTCLSKQVKKIRYQRE